ncbi:hypothetical protein GGS24DRAFT_482474, partial [Hypoxylon argillaceum]
TYTATYLATYLATYQATYLATDLATYIYLASYLPTTLPTILPTTLPTYRGAGAKSNRKVRGVVRLQYLACLYGYRPSNRIQHPFGLSSLFSYLPTPTYTYLTTLLSTIYTLYVYCLSYLVN